MALDTLRVLRILEAGEDFAQALSALIDLINREAELGNGNSGLENLVLMGQIGFLLKKTDSPAILASERAYYNPTRLGINRRAKKSRAKRAGQKGIKYVEES